MNDQELTTTPVSYFPGCSLVTSARENDASLREVCSALGFRLEEVPDWNCCGSSSAHCLDREMAFWLAARNLALADPERPLLVACPNCYKRLRRTQLEIAADPELRQEFEKRLGPFPDTLHVVPFLVFLAGQDPKRFDRTLGTSLHGLRFAPYYGCMLAKPPILAREPSMLGVMEEVLTRWGGEAVDWGHAFKCCGTFLSVARPDMVGPLVESIMNSAVQAGADCLVTACAMCHLNLEVRSAPTARIPIFHFSELLALAAGYTQHLDWFNRHLIDPKPVLRRRGLYK